MNTVNIILFILLVLAMAVSWYMGYRSQRFFRPSLRYNKDERDYFIGLNYLLNDEPDQSVDAFISELEVNSSTLESHLALGTLLTAPLPYSRNYLATASLIKMNSTRLNSGW